MRAELDAVSQGFLDSFPDLDDHYRILTTLEGLIQTYQTFQNLLNVLKSKDFNGATRLLEEVQFILSTFLTTGDIDPQVSQDVKESKTVFLKLACTLVISLSNHLSWDQYILTRVFISFQFTAHTNNSAI